MLPAFMALTTLGDSAECVSTAGFLGRRFLPRTHPSRHSVSWESPVLQVRLGLRHIFPLGIGFFRKPLAGDSCGYLATSIYNSSNIQKHDIPVTLATESRKPHMQLSAFLGGKGKVLTAIASQKKAQMNTSWTQALAIGTGPRQGKITLSLESALTAEKAFAYWVSAVGQALPWF